MSLTMDEPLLLRSHHWTVDDLDDLPPDEFHRYEIIDGVLVVSGSPRMRHQRAAFRMAKLLDGACPPECEVFIAPFAVVLAFDTMMQPDVLVARVADLTESELPAPPVLAVEVLSPGSRKIDLELKAGRLERAGTPHYWVIDPAQDPAKAMLRAHTLINGAYVLVAEVTGEEEFVTLAPFPVTVTPAALVA